MQNQESSSVFYGGFFVRLAAVWVDALLVSIALLFLRMPVWAGVDNPLYQPILFQFTPWDIFLYLLGSSYYVLLTYLMGATFGKRLFSLRVVAADGRKLSFFDVLYRETIGKYLSGAFLCIGYIMAAADREKRALHDMLCDTRVVYSFSKRPEFVEPVSANAESDAAKVTESYRNVEDYYRRSKEEKYPAADYGYKKPEETVEVPSEAEESTEMQDSSDEAVEMPENQDSSDGASVK